MKNSERDRDNLKVCGAFILDEESLKAFPYMSSLTFSKHFTVIWPRISHTESHKSIQNFYTNATMSRTVELPITE